MRERESEREPKIPTYFFARSSSSSLSLTGSIRKRREKKSDSLFALTNEYECRKKHDHFADPLAVVDLL